MANTPHRVDEIQGEIVHVYDNDIEEADNHLPRWWLYTLYGSLFFGFSYWIFFHGFKVGDLPEQSYEKAVAAQLSSVEVTDEYLLEQAKDLAMVDEGRKIFTSKCATCHGENAAGLVKTGAPNLTDNMWIHGGSPVAIHKTIFNGIPGKMDVWSRKIGPDKVIKASAYVLSIRNTNVPGAPPQGKPYSEDAGDAGVDNAQPTRDGTSSTSTSKPTAAGDKTPHGDNAPDAP